MRDQTKLDPLVDDALAKGWPLKRIDAIIRAVMRAGAYELEHRKDVPARVVVTEYVDVANAFVDREETGMVNAVLDQLARRFRADEFSRDGAIILRFRASCEATRRIDVSTTPVAASFESARSSVALAPASRV